MDRPDDARKLASASKFSSIPRLHTDLTQSEAPPIGDTNSPPAPSHSGSGGAITDVLAAAKEQMKATEVGNQADSGSPSDEETPAASSAAKSDGSLEIETGETLAGSSLESEGENEEEKEDWEAVDPGKNEQLIAKLMECKSLHTSSTGWCHEASRIWCCLCSTVYSTSYGWDGDVRS
jgi:hypothetical protein